MLLRSILLIHFNLGIDLQNALFPSTFPTKTFYAFPPPPPFPNKFKVEINYALLSYDVRIQKFSKAKSKKLRSGLHL